jgi:hypothetical protein
MLATVVMKKESEEMASITTTAVAPADTGPSQMSEMRRKKMEEKIQTIYLNHLCKLQQPELMQLKKQFLEMKPQVSGSNVMMMLLKKPKVECEE